jgi:hypothetical protein
MKVVVYFKEGGVETFRCSIVQACDFRDLSVMRLHKVAVLRHRKGQTHFDWSDIQSITIEGL